MKKCKRTIHATLVAVLLTAALPVAAKTDSRNDQTACGLFAKIEVIVAKLWPFTTTQPGSGSTERVRVFEKIGPEGSPVGGAAPTGDTNLPPSTHDPASPQGG